ncbi:MAG: hypothetical protein P4L84_37305 [Isosphaeraceae bacterium]|nr:hypothetical protein [Isosphaeraceae bacterium]
MPAGSLEWRGDEVRKSIERLVEARMTQAGEAGVEAARELVPVKTGRTKASLEFSYDRATQTLRISAGTPWAVFIEMGTSRVAARPFLRPGMIAAGRAFGGSGGTA